jgi:hypothetical protein
MGDIPMTFPTGVMYHEAFERLVAQYTGQTGMVYSTLFGRQDLGYASDGVLGAITAGRYIRGITGVNDTISICLKDLFTSLSLYCIGLGMIDGKLRIEQMDYWFQSVVILDISDRINVMTIAKEVIPELLVNQITVGFNSFLYDRTGGIYEYNTSSDYTTILKIQNELKIVSPYRGDMTGIMKLIDEGAATTDTTEDAGIYMLDLVRGGLILGVRTNEGFDYESGGSNTNQDFNLMFTPARTLRRWGRYIRAMMEHWTDSYINWQSSDKSTTLVTKLTGEPEVAENANIKVDDLATPLWHPERYVIEAYLSNDEFNAIYANPYGLIKIGTDKYGWILDCKCTNDNKLMELTLLRANLNYITPC